MLFQKVKRIYTRLIFLSAMFIIDQSRNTSQLKYCAELSQLLSFLQLQVCDILANKHAKARVEGCDCSLVE